MAALVPPGQRRTKLGSKHASAPFNNWTLVPRDQLKNRTNGANRSGNMNMVKNGNGSRKDNNHLDANSYNNPNNNHINNNHTQNGIHSQSRLNFGKCDAPAHSEAFPERYTMCGMLDVRTNKKRAWKRRYFVLSNNFLLCGATQFAKKLERVTALEGSKILTRGYQLPAPTNSGTSSNSSSNRSSTSSSTSSSSNSNNNNNSSNSNSSNNNGSKEDDNKSDHNSMNSNSKNSNSSGSRSSSSSSSSNNSSGKSSYNSDPRNRFELMLRTKKILYFRATSSVHCEKWCSNIERASVLKIKDMYRFLYTLGTSESQMTKVVSAKHKATGEDCAIKIVDKRTCDSKMLQSEIKILKKLDSEFIVQLYDLFETKKFLYIVMEKCEGGELFDQIADLDGDHYTETDCCRVMYQIAHGVKYMHSQGIVHRDLKPENILCVEPKSIRKVKIADFGISKMVKNPQKFDSTTFETMAGTLSYTAPEILRGKGYKKAVDCWSIGVIMYILLCGYAPFWGESDSELSYEILKREVDFEKEDWEHVSEDSIKLVTGLLDKNPETRYTLDDTIKLTWKKTSKIIPNPKFQTKFRKFVTKRKKQKLLSAPFAQSSVSRPNKYMSHMGGNYAKDSVAHLQINSK